MISVYIWRSSRCSLIPSGHASLVVCPEDRTNPDTVCTWFGEGRGGSSGSTSSSWRNNSSCGSSKGDGASYPNTPLQEWGRNFINPGNYNMLDKVTRFANDHPNDPIAQKALTHTLKSSFFPPSDAIYIRSISDSDSYIGLSEDMICRWWDNFTNRENRYHLLQQNCSTITATALMAGGGCEFADPPVGSSMFWTPDQAFQFAKDIKKVIDKKQEKMSQGAMLLDQLIDEAPISTHVWTPEEWYEASEENVGWYSRRYSALKEIDRRLDFYHNELLPDNEISADFKSECIIRELSEIEYVLCNILAKRPRTKRAAAFGLLGMQCRKKREAERDAIHDRQRRREEERQPFLDRQDKLRMKMSRLAMNSSMDPVMKVNKIKSIRAKLAEVEQQLEVLG